MLVGIGLFGVLFWFCLGKEVILLLRICFQYYLFGLMFCFLGVIFWLFQIFFKFCQEEEEGQEVDFVFFYVLVLGWGRGMQGEGYRYQVLERIQSCVCVYMQVQYVQCVWIFFFIVIDLFQSISSFVFKMEMFIVRIYLLVVIYNLVGIILFNSF